MRRNLQQRTDPPIVRDRLQLQRPNMRAGLRYVNDRTGGTGAFCSIFERESHVPVQRNTPSREYEIDLFRVASLGQQKDYRRIPKIVRRTQELPL